MNDKGRARLKVATSSNGACSTQGHHWTRHWYPAQHPPATAHTRHACAGSNMKRVSAALMQWVCLHLSQVCQVLLLLQKGIQFCTCRSIKEAHVFLVHPNIPTYGCTYKALTQSRMSHHVPTTGTLGISYVYLFTLCWYS